MKRYNNSLHNFAYNYQHMIFPYIYIYIYIYAQQVLTLSQTTLSQLTVGHVINLASNDVHRFDEVSTFLKNNNISFPSGTHNMFKVVLTNLIAALKNLVFFTLLL